MRYSTFRFTFCALLLAVMALGQTIAQDSRGTILGTIVDQQKAVIPGVSVVLVYLDTNQTRTTVTNDTGYYEFPLLQPGNYSLTAELQGFRKYSRSSIVVNVASRINIDITLEVGGINEVVQVSEAAPLLETASASSGRVIDNAMIVSLPFSDLNPFALTGLSAGMQWTGQPEYRRPFDNGGTSSFNTAGGVGQNEYTIDGAPVTGTGRRVGFVPPADAIQEFRLQTGAFDASVGHTSGAVVNVESKAGSNQIHGSIYEQHWQQRWNATMHFPRLAWEDNVRSGKWTKDKPKQGPGRSNQFGATIGAPVYLPWLFNGKDKLFFFFSYNGIYQSKAETTDSVNRSVPKMNWRTGDFSDLLAIDPAKYQIYDPRTARLDSGRVVRDPFPGNKGIPILNPVYKFYEKLYPQPNNVPGLVSAEGANNYLAAQMPKNERFNSILNRYDYVIGSNHRLDAKWYWNHRLADEYDWTYETARGMHANGLTRINKGGSGNWTWTVNSRNVMQLTTSWTRFNEGNVNDLVTSFKPSDVGLPGYLDAKAGDVHALPRLDFDSVEDVSGSYPAITSRGTTFEVKWAMNTVLGRHSLKYGYAERRYWFVVAGPGNSSGYFSYRNSFMRRIDNDTLASNRGLEWASFMMGLPSNGISIDTNDTQYLSTRFRDLYIQDDWRISNKLSVNLGLRFEIEGGTTERFNRAEDSVLIADAKLPITDAAQAAYATVYAANPTLGLRPPSEFKVLGGVGFLSDSNKSWTDGYKRLLPRAGIAYRFLDKTVLRIGYGWFMDTFNVMNDRPSQPGFSQSTGTNLSTDLGLNFCCGIGAAANLSASKTALHDPFPVRADGTRFDSPYGNYLGLMHRVGGGAPTILSKAYQPPFQQRYRIGIQHQLRNDMVFEISYNGAFSHIPVSKNLRALPGQYWATGNARNQALDDELQRNITNPFNINNFKALQTSDPKLYNWMTTQSFFTSGTIRKQQLLRDFPQFTGLSGAPPGLKNIWDIYGHNIYNDFQFEFTKRLSHGFATNFSWTHTFNCKVSDWYENEFNAKPSYRLNVNLTPNRWVWSTQFQLPFGKGRKYANTGWYQNIVGGWEVNWVYNLQDGRPEDWGNRFFYGDLNNLEQLFNHDATFSKDIHQWFDPNVPFEKATAKQPGSYHVRVFPSRLAALRRDGIDNWDINVMRRFKITEKVSSRFYVDFLNAFNQTWFGSVNTDPTSTNFGKVTSQRGLSRVIQFNFRVEF